MKSRDYPIEIGPRAVSKSHIVGMKVDCCFRATFNGATRAASPHLQAPCCAGTRPPALGGNHPANKIDIGEFNYDLGPSVIGGGTLGCSWQGASPLVLGFEGEGGYMRVAASAVVPYSFGTSSDTVALTRIGDKYAAVTGRVGYAWDRVLVYLKSGLGFADIHSSVIDGCTAAPCSPGLLTATASSHQPFWVAGAGVEYAFDNNWSVKGEFLILGMYRTYAVCGPGAALRLARRSVETTTLRGFIPSRWA